MESNAPIKVKFWRGFKGTYKGKDIAYKRGDIINPDREFYKFLLKKKVIKNIKIITISQLIKGGK